MLMIRLSRRGARKQPYYRIVVIEKDRARDGRSVEVVGTYNPRTNPATVELKVVDTEPSVKGATAAAQYKPATMETGLIISVPPFIGVGEVIQVDTRTGEHLSRAK